MSEGRDGLRQRAFTWIDGELWGDFDSLHRARSVARSILQIGIVVIEGVSRHHLLMRARALTYYAVLALVPLLAIVMAIVGAFGVDSNLAELAVERVAAGSPEAKARILELVGAVNFGALGTVGAGFLLGTTVLGLVSVERNLNAIWEVDRPRGWERRIPDYFAVLLVAPLLLAVAISVGTSLRSDAVVSYLLEMPGFEQVYRLGLRQLPIVLTSLGFSLLYWFLPNTRVRFLSALLGGVVAGSGFSAAEWAYVTFHIGVSRSNALFGTLAALPLLLVWIYVSWVIVLVGAEVAVAHQRLGSLRRAHRVREVSAADRESIGLAVAAEAARAFHAAEGPVAVDDLCDRLDAPGGVVRALVEDLARAGILGPAADEDRVQLARAAESVALSDLLRALRGSRDPRFEELGGERETVRELLSELDRSVEERLAGRTLADLVSTSRGD
jgi:membrane protein